MVAPLYKFDRLLGLGREDDLAGITNPMQFKGGITIPADFPTLALVQNGWVYTILANVTDNDVTKTNTGQSFLQGDEIVWNGSNWTNMGNATLVAGGAYNLQYNDGTNALAATSSINVDSPANAGLVSIRFIHQGAATDASGLKVTGFTWNGIQGIANGAPGHDTYGIAGRNVSGGITDNRYGGRFEASDGAVAVGVYGTASGAPINYAAYFDLGDVYIQNGLIDSNLTAGIPVSEIGVTGLVGFAATSIVGALNEAKATATGNTYYNAVVDAAGGGDYTDIYSAILANPTGAIFIRNGAYSLPTTGAIVLTSANSGLHLIGESRAGVVITDLSATNGIATDASQVDNINFESMTFVENSNVDFIAFYGPTNNWTFTNCTMNGSAGNSQRFILPSDVNKNIYFNTCEFFEFGYTVITASGVDVDGIFFTDCIVRDFVGPFGIDTFTNGKGLSFINTIFSNIYCPILANGAGNRSHRISGCRFITGPLSVAGYGILIAGAIPNIVISDNIFEQIGADEFYASIEVQAGATGTTITGNSIEGGTFEGIGVYVANYSTVSGNAVRNCSGKGIHVPGGTGLSISGNTITGCDIGINTNTTTDLIMIGNNNRGNITNDVVHAGDAGLQSAFNFAN